MDTTTVNTSEIEGYITNALGEKVPLYKEYKGDFKTGTMSDGRRSLENIEIARNPDIQEFFKYNKKDNMGYMVFYDIKNKKEVKKGTHLPLQLLYPFTIDTAHGVVSTKLEEDYPILFTDEPTPENVKKMWEDLEHINQQREVELSKKRSSIVSAVDLSSDEEEDDEDFNDEDEEDFEDEE